jgi:hypothetical protein
MVWGFSPSELKSRTPLQRARQCKKRPRCSRNTAFLLESGEKNYFFIPPISSFFMPDMSSPDFIMPFFIFFFFIILF